MASKNVQEFSSDNWQSEVASSSTPVLVDFWAPWCGPCRQLAPVLDRIADKYAGKVKVGKVNVDENNDLASKYGVSSIPRLLVFKGSDQPVAQEVGLLSDAALSAILDKVV